MRLRSTQSFPIISGGRRKRDGGKWKVRKQTLSPFHSPLLSLLKVQSHDESILQDLQARA